MSALRRILLAFGALVFAYVAFTAVVAAGALNLYDRDVANFALEIWDQRLRLIFWAIAELGGMEVTTILTLGLAAYLWRAGFGFDTLAAAAMPVAVGLELVYKRLLFHPGPGPTISHGDGPSLLSELGGQLVVNSYPSGHMARAVVVYGLLGFVIHRLTTREWVRRAAIPIAVLLVILMAVDRLYLGVHWESDVIGGLLLGGICLAGAIIWLDRPVGEAG
jgi:membrane-associated phospholipid phosphatase